jgi:Ser-tRNA(Ala) deacylase AlaX
MQSTELLYLKDYRALSCQARVLDVREEEGNGRSVVVLDQTIFYPQGGGQPYDQGYIESPSARLRVEEVRYNDGAVNHIGVFVVRSDSPQGSGSFAEGDEVVCTVDKERRELLSRIHSAGHVVDWAVLNLGLPWKPGKGYHFPDGPYVEYEGIIEESNREDATARRYDKSDQDLSGEPRAKRAGERGADDQREDATARRGGADDQREDVKNKIEEECSRIIAEDHETKAMFVEKEEMAALCHFVPENIPTGKPGRIMRFGDLFGVPCGGTHVGRLGEISKMAIRKIKQSGQNIRVGYEVK